MALFTIYKNRKQLESSGQKIIRHLVYFLLSANIFATFVGLSNGFYKHIPADIFNSISGLTVAYAVASTPLNHKKIDKFLKEFSYIFLVTFVFTLITLEIGTNKGFITYPALYPSGLVIAYVFFSASTKKIKLLKKSVFVLILLSIKRSSILTFLSVSIFLSVLAIFKNFWLSIVLCLASITLIVFSLFTITSTLEKNSPIIISNSVKRINSINPLSDSFNLAKDSGGHRLAEVISVLNTFKKNGYSWWFGAGNGFIYNVEYKTIKYKYPMHNVHFTPMAIISRYGILLSSIIGIVLCLYLHWIVTNYSHLSPQLRPFAFYQIFGFANTCFSYAIATDFILWMSLGIVINKYWGTNTIGIHR